jgi:predicted GIY-YIG superfamily endonuclease
MKKQKQITLQYLEALVRESEMKDKLMKIKKLVYIKKNDGDNEVF